MATSSTVKSCLNFLVVVLVTAVLVFSLLMWLRHKELVSSVLAHPHHDHSPKSDDRSPYEQCRYDCDYIMETCYANKCVGIKEDQPRMNCWLKCASKPELISCYENCDELLPKTPPKVDAGTK